MLARFVVNSHVKHHPNREENTNADDDLMVSQEITKFKNNDKSFET